jgi:hypothetical protein
MAVNYYSMAVNYYSMVVNYYSRAVNYCFTAVNYNSIITLEKSRVKIIAVNYHSIFYKIVNVTKPTYRGIISW